MTGIEIFGVGFSIILALYASWMIVGPFFTNQEEADNPRSEEIDLLTKQDRLLGELADLDQSFEGKALSEEEFQTTREELMAEVAECIARLEKLHSGKS